MNRSTLVPRVMLLVFGAVTLLPVTIAAGTQPTSSTAEPAITGGPKAWALATTALLAYRNNERVDILPPNVPNKSNVAQTRGLLRDWWRIDNRSDLLQKLEWLEREGHRTEFQLVGDSLAGMTDAQYQATLSAARNNRDLVAALKLARDYYRKYRRSSLLAWDCCRYIMLCRYGYMVGFLNEYETWRRIMPAARVLQDGFGSWAELGEDYLVGREYWSREETDRTGRYFRDIETRLVKEPRSVWNQLPWQTRLGPGSPAK